MKKIILAGCMFILVLSLCGCPKQLVKDINIPMDNDVKISSTTINVDAPIEIEKVIDLSSTTIVVKNPIGIKVDDNKVVSDMRLKLRIILLILMLKYHQQLLQI